MKIIPQRDTIQTIVGVVLSLVAGHLLSKWDFLLAWLTAYISYKLLLMLSLTELFVLLLVVPYILYKKRNIPPKSITKENADIFHNILSLIAQYHSQEISATPKRIAKDLGLDQKIIFAHMEKMHDDQFITFRNDGKRPDIETPFFLSANAWKHIAIVKKNPNHERKIA